MRIAIMFMLLASACDRYGDCAPDPLWVVDIDSIAARATETGFVALGAEQTSPSMFAHELVAISSDGDVTARTPVDIGLNFRGIAVGDDGAPATGGDTIVVYDAALAERYRVSDLGVVFPTVVFDLGPSNELAYLSESGLRLLEPDGTERWHLGIDVFASAVRVASTGDVFAYSHGQVTRLRGSDGAILGDAITVADGDTVAITRRGEVVTSKLVTSGTVSDVVISSFDAGGASRWETTLTLSGTPIIGFDVTANAAIVVAAHFAAQTIADVDVDGFAVVALDGATGAPSAASANCHVGRAFTADAEGYLANFSGALSKYPLRDR